MGLTIITSTSFFFFFFCFSFTYPFGYRACIQHRKRERHRTHTTHTQRDTVSPRPEDVKEDIEFLCVSGVCGTSGAGFNQHISFIYGPTNQDCVSLPHTHKPKYIYPSNGFVRSFVTKSEKFSLPIQFQSVRQVCLTRCHSTDGSGPTRQSFYFLFSILFFLAVIKNWCTRERERERLISRQMQGSEQEMGIPCFLSSSVADRSIPDDVAGAVARKIVATFPSVCFDCRPYEGKGKEDDNTFWLFATSHRLG